MKSKYFALIILVFMLSSLSEANDEINYYTDLTRELCKEHGRIVHIYRKESVTLIEYKDGYLYIANVLGMPEIENNNNNSNSNETQAAESNGMSKTEYANYLSLGYKPRADLSRQQPDNTIVITPKGQDYHYLRCGTIKDLCKPVSINEAKQLGRTACKVCNPPQ